MVSTTREKILRKFGRYKGIKLQVIEASSVFSSKDVEQQIRNCKPYFLALERRPGVACSAFFKNPEELMKYFNASNFPELRAHLERQNIKRRIKDAIKMDCNLMDVRKLKHQLTEIAEGTRDKVEGIRDITETQKKTYLERLKDGDYIICRTYTNKLPF